MNPIIFDIETAPLPDLQKWLDEKTYTPPENYKNPQTINNWIEKAKEKDKTRAALHWWTGRIICISYQTMAMDKPHCFYGGSDEAKTIAMFVDVCCMEHARCDSGVTLVGKSSKDFDVPFLKGRMMALDLGIPDFLRSRIEEVDDCLSYSRSCGQRGKLTDYAYGLGIEGKTTDALQSLEWFRQIEEEGLTENWTLIADYCNQDVAITAEMYRRWVRKYEPTVVEGYRD